MSYSLQASASSSASAGPSASGPIGGTAWNIQGINFGTQNEAPATAGGASAAPVGALASTNGLPDWAVPLAIAVVAMLGVTVYLTRR